MKRDKKGISPLIATVLLIVVAIILFLLIFMWLRGFQKEAITKQGTAIELMCREISFDMAYNNPQLQIVNMGDVPLYDVNIYIVSGTKTEFKLKMGEITQGTTATNSNVGCDSGEQIKAIPVLLGTTKTNSQEEYVCEDQAQTISCS